MWEAGFGVRIGTESANRRARGKPGSLLNGGGGARRACRQEGSKLPGGVATLRLGKKIFGVAAREAGVKNMTEGVAT